MSVRTGIRRSSLIRFRTTRPSSSPGPRKLELLVRLALSKLALKMYVRLSFWQMAWTWRAMVRHNSADSMTQGPAMTNKGKRVRSRSDIGWHSTGGAGAGPQNEAAIGGLKPTLRRGDDEG